MSKIGKVIIENSLETKGALFSILLGELRSPSEVKRLRQAYKFDLFSTTCVSKLVEPLSFFLEFCYKAGNFEELNEFLSKKFEFIEGSVLFSV